MKKQIVQAAMIFGAAFGLMGGAVADEFPQGPKIEAPSSMPAPLCDVNEASDGTWMLGQWVAPFSKWTFSKDAQGYHWKLDRKGNVGEDFGWQSQAQITGEITQVTPCTAILEAGEGAFVMHVALTEEGRIFGVAKNTKGKEARFILRPQR